MNKLARLILLSTTATSDPVFRSTWQTDKVGPSSDFQITLPLEGTGLSL